MTIRNRIPTKPPRYSRALFYLFILTIVLFVSAVGSVIELS